MARDPNERIGAGEWLESAEDLKLKGITPPVGYVVGTGSGQYYAHYQIHADGHTTVEWYKRGAGGGGENPDPVALSQPGPPNTKIKTEWDKEEAKPDPTVNIGGVPNVVVGKDANGRDIYGPAMTTTGPAQPAGTAAVPADAVPRTEGTPTGKTLPDGTPERDNTKPIKVWRRPDGSQVKVEALDAAERTQWEREQNPGGKSDAEVRAEAAKAAAPPQAIATNTTEPFIVQQGPDGKLTSQPNPNYKGPETKPGTNIQIKGGDGKTYIVPIDAQGNVGTPRDLNIPGEAAGRKEEEIVNPADHKTYIKVTTTDPATNQIRIFHLDPATRQEVTLPGSAMAGIKGVAPFTPDLTKPGAGLIDRAKQLDELMQAGTLTWEQRQEILAQDQVLASTVAKDFNAGVAVLQDTYQNQTSQRNADVSNSQHRAALANTHLTNAMGLMEKFSPYLGGTPGATSKLFLSTMAAQLALSTQYGGMKDIPREQMDPNVAAWAQRAVGGAGAAPGAAPGAPSAAPGAAPAGGPNALGLGAIGAVPAPGAPAALPDPAAAAAEAARQQATAAGGAPTLGPAVNRFDTGPGNTLGPRVMTPSSSAGMPPPPPGYAPALSWRDNALQQEDFLTPPDPASVGLGEQAMGQALPPMGGMGDPMGGMGDPMGGPLDFGATMGQAPLALSSSVAGLTAEQDAQARRELDQHLFQTAGRWG